MKLPIFEDPEDQNPLASVLSSLEPMAPRGEVRLPDGGPGSAEVGALLGAVLGALQKAGDGTSSRLVTLEHLSAEARTLLDETLGVGEVTVHVHGRHSYDCVETVLPGLWRVRTYGDQKVLVSDHLEVAQVPAIVRAANDAATKAELRIGTPPEGAMNVLPLLAELRHRMRQSWVGKPNHIVNFTLLPMNEVDMAYLEQQLGHGPVEAESRGYGRCRVQLTAHRNIWSVQYFNAMGTVILDTLEVGDVPEALRAATSDFEDSAVRLGDLVTVGS